MKNKILLIISLVSISFLLLLPKRIDALEKTLYINRNKNYDGIYYSTNFSPATQSKFLAERNGKEYNAYCIQPGLSFNPQNYILTKEINLSSCTKLTDDSGYCGLAAILQYAERNYTTEDDKYFVANVALRLWTVSKIDTKQNNTVEAGYYKDTVSYINNHMNYTGDGCDVQGVLCGYNAGEYPDSNKYFKKGLEVFKKAISGELKIEKPTFELVNTDYEGKIAKLRFKTNLTSGSEITGVSSSKVNVKSYRKEESAGIIYLLAEVDTTNLNGSSYSITVNHNDPNSVYKKIGIYKPSVYTNDQKMFVFEKNSSVSVDVKVSAPRNCSCLVNNDGSSQCFDKEGNPTDYDEYIKICTVACQNKVENNTPDNCEKSTTGSIKDAPMCSILKSGASAKYRKYSNSYCEVFCRDEHSFRFMSKAEALSGRYFQYNVSSKYSGNDFYSTVVITTRECTSLIDTYKIDKATDVEKANCNLEKGTDAYKAITTQYNPVDKYSITYNKNYDEDINITVDSQLIDSTVKYYKAQGSARKVDTINSYCNSCDNSFAVNSGEGVVTMIFDIESLIYQGAHFSTNIYTGRIGNGTGSNWLSMGTHVYPVELTKKTGNYEVNVDYKVTNGSGKFTCDYDVINEVTTYYCEDPKSPRKCPDGPETNPGDDPSGNKTGLYFRSVDLNKLFNSNTLPANWDTTNGKNITEEIQTLGDSIWTKTPMYTISLTSSDINAIKKYNKEKEDKNGYLDESLICDDNGHCNSEFLEEELKTILGNGYNSKYKKTDLYNTNDGKLYYYNK